MRAAIVLRVVLGLVASGIVAGDASAQTCDVDAEISCNAWSAILVNGGLRKPPLCVSDESTYNGCAGAHVGGEDTFHIAPPAGTEVWVAALQGDLYGGLSGDFDLIVQEDDCGDNAGLCVDAAETAGRTDELVTFVADGGDYYISVDSDQANCGQGYRLSVGCPETCDAAVDVARQLSCSSDLVGQTTLAGSKALDWYHCGDPYPATPQINEEVIYAFVPQATGSVTFRLGNLSSDHDIYVLEDICDQSACIASANDASVAVDSVTFTAEAGRTYYIVVEAFDGPGTFDLSFEEDTGGCVEDCDDGLDNDLDGDVDCDDADCAADPVCAGPVEVCGNGLDDDGDGLDDCADPDCPDTDGDGVADDCDLCAGGDDGLDLDADGIPDGCDDCTALTDADGDGVVDDCDACPSGDDAADLDGDGIADACDPCPSDPGAADADGDGDYACDDCDDADPALHGHDLDGDGVSSCDGDCDDLDAGVSAGAIELPEGVDQDCDGIVDEDTIWSDDDGDGFAEAGGDCDDGGPASPATPEDCDGVDDDCDGVIDDGTDCFDDDGDGATEQDGDCNDGDALVGPSAVEVLGNGVDDDCDGGVDGGAPDADGDGVTEAGGDCAPEDGAVHPGAPEVENGVDDDCDGIVDEGTAAYDDDGDGVTEADGDCHDGDPGVVPGGDEVENGVDDDCDGDVDDGTDAFDDDGDGVTERGGDCDDDDAGVFPGAPEAANGVDDDCDELVDEDSADLDGDGVAAPEDCDDEDGWIRPGQAERCDGVDDDCDGAVDEGCVDEIAAEGRTGGCGCDVGGGALAPGFAVGFALVVGAARRRKGAR